MAILEKVALVIKGDQLWDWNAMGLRQNFLIAHMNPDVLSNSYSAIYSSASTPGSPLPQDFYVGGTPHVLSFSLEFDDAALITHAPLRGDGTIFKRLNTQDSIDWLQIVQLPDINSYNDVGLELEPPTLLFVWGDRQIFEWKMTIGPVSEKRFESVTKKTISASVPITLSRYLGSFVRR